MNQSEVRALAIRLALDQVGVASELAAGKKVTRDDLYRHRVCSITTAALGLARAEPSRAAEILLEDIQELQRFGCGTHVFLPLIAELAPYDPDKARQLIRRPLGRFDWGTLARRLARKDPSLVSKFAAAKRRSKAPVMDDEAWMAAAYGRMKEDPLAALALARKHLKSSRYRPDVLCAAVAAVARKDLVAAEQAVRVERNPAIRAPAWIIIARWSRGRQRLTALRRAEEAVEEMGRGGSPRERFHRVQLWALMTFLVGRRPMARRYLAALEGAMSKPPREAELAAALAAAVYAEPAKALAIYRRLNRRADKTRWFHPAWYVLDTVAPFLGRLDPDAAAAIVAQRADRRNEVWSVAACYAELAYDILEVSREQAHRMIERAESAMLLDLRAAKRRPKDETAVWHKRDALEGVAWTWTRAGRPDRSLRLIARHADPVQAVELYLDLVGQLDRFSSPGLEIWPKSGG